MKTKNLLIAAAAEAAETIGEDRLECFANLQLKKIAEKTWGKNYCKNVLVNCFDNNLQRFYSHVREVLKIKN